MKRRDLMLAGAAGAAWSAGLARPAIAHPAKTLKFVPSTSLTSLDPVWTTASVTRGFGYVVYETLFGYDEQLRPRPLMVDGMQTEDGGKRVTLRLREGMLFHDGTPVLARDCTASLRRWMVRDPLGQTITDRMDALEAPDDRTIVFRMKKPFFQLTRALAKTQPTPVIMPERLALTDPYKQVTEVVGSGAFRFLKDEFVAGSAAAFAKFDRYVPREEPTSFAAGAHRALVDQVEWHVIPDAATAAGALLAGEVDWVEMPLPDLIPKLRQSSDITVAPVDLNGIFLAMRPNHIQRPTDNVALRRAMLAAIDQREVMTAVMGDETGAFNAPIGFFIPGSESANDAGMASVRDRPGTDAIRKMVEQSGYRGEPVVVMHPTDQSFYDAATQVVVASWRKVGITVDDVSMDWGTVTQRRPSKEPLSKGGWSAFPSGLPAGDYVNPALAILMRGNGPTAWFGWPTDPKIEEIRDAWIDSADAAEKSRLAEAMQARAFETVPFIPLGQYFQSSAWRNSLSTPQKGLCPVFWGIQKA